MFTVKIYANTAYLIAYKQWIKVFAKVDFRLIRPMAAICYSGPIQTKFGQVV